MKCTNKLSEAETHTWQQISVNRQHRDIRTRAAGRLLLGNGLSAPKAVARLDVSAQSIYNWSRLRAEQDSCRLLGGRPRALSEAVLATAMKVARAESMTRGQIAKRIEAVYGESMPCAGNLIGCPSTGRLPVQAKPALAQKKAGSGRLRDEAGHARQTAMCRTRQRRASGLSR